MAKAPEGYEHTDPKTGQKWIKRGGEWHRLEADAEIPGWLGMLRGFNRGASLGLSEMAIPAGQALYESATGGGDFGQRYTEIKAQRAQEAEAMPAWANMLSEGVGGIGTGILGAGRALGSFALRHPFIASIPAGATAGGVYGGATAPAGETLGGAAEGAGVGALTGPLGYGVARGISAGIEAGKRGLAPRAPQIFRREVLEPAGLSADEVAIQMARSGPGTTALEVTGPPGTRAAQFAAGRSPASGQRLRNVIDARLAGKWDRLKGDMRRLLGKEGGRFYRELESVKEARKAQAAPYYAAMAEDSVDATKVAELDLKWDSYLSEGMTDSSGKKIAALRGTSFEKFVKRAKRALVRGTTKDPVYKTDLPDLDLAKDEIDKMYSLAKDGRSRMVVTRLKRDLTDMADEASDDYRQARSIYSAESDVIDAMELGKKVLREDAELTQMMLEDMSQAERDAYLIGAAKALRDAAGSKPPQFFYRHGGIRERLAFAFPDEKSLDEFLNVSLTREARLGELSSKILHGSQTQPRQEAVSGIARSAADFFEGNTASSGFRLVQALRNAWSDEYPEEVVQELTDLLLESEPDKFAEAAAKALKPRHFDEMRRMFTSAGTLTGAETGVSLKEAAIGR